MGMQTPSKIRWRRMASVLNTFLFYLFPGGLIDWNIEVRDLTKVFNSTLVPNIIAALTLKNPQDDKFCLIE